jgi:hypothetical protein
MKKVNGRLRILVMIARYGPKASGTRATTLLAIASTIFVPERMPVRIPAARMTETTESTLPAWCSMRSLWSFSVG